MENIKDTYLVIVNPNAGGRQGKKDWPKIEAMIIDAGLKYKKVLTEYRHHAIKLTKMYVAQGYRKLICVGGDGTINEVVNGIMTSKANLQEVSFGVIMIGTGNDWGRMFDIPTDYKKALKVIIDAKKFQQDVGRVTYFLGKEIKERFFINAAGIGFDAMVVQNANTKKDKGKSGKFSYLITLFKTLMKYKNLNINVTIEDRQLVGSELFTMGIGIGRFSGGGMQQVPKAVADDGLFDIMLVNNISKAKIIYKIKKLYNGEILDLKEVNMFKAKSLVVSSTDKVMLEVDGESLGHSPFTFEIIPERLNVIVN
ncbi:MAG: hypothetical protein AUJ98_06465 [Bacteroidetes bacterium CG2_30_33_31]|nr:MAG: hypothetical protein AUJ98_06465 [Bacteroidetes bacterium CG2_30_33_31]